MENFNKKIWPRRRLGRRETSNKASHKHQDALLLVFYLYSRIAYVSIGSLHNLHQI